MKIHNIYKDQRHRILERDKCVMQTYSYNRKRLKPEEAHAYRDTWAQTHLVTIDEGQPPNRNLTLKISPIIVMGASP